MHVASVFPFYLYILFIYKRILLHKEKISLNGFLYIFLGDLEFSTKDTLLSLTLFITVTGTLRNVFDKAIEYSMLKES